MNGFVFNLPPVQEVHSDRKDLQGYLEIEVSHISFITLKQVKEKSEEKEEYVTDTPIKSVSLVGKDISQDLYNIKYKEEICNNRSNQSLNSVQVKLVWFGEKKEDSANLYISCASQQAVEEEKIQIESSQQNQQQQQENCKFKTTKKRQHFKRQHKHKHQLLLVSANNKLRYRICTSVPLFLEYLRSCKPIEILVYSTSGGSCSTLAAKPLGQAQLRLPSVLINKFNHNIAKGHNFEYNTKVYALYKNNKTSAEIIKSGEIQLRFKMLFAPTAAAAATAVSAKHSVNIINEEQLTSSLHAHHHHNHHHHHRHMNSKSKVPEANQGDIPKRLTSQSKSEEIVEAMKKLDAKLVAYLAGETEISSKLTNCEEENEVNMNLENNNISNHLEDLLPATKLNIFKSIDSIKLEMEALTLQPDGTKCMDLMQNEIRPIFTVECQLSNELIKQVPRHDMFHLMQFESEKFQSLTQCTRFGQQASRSVKLEINEGGDDENANELQVDFGRIHFTVWWREPGTCLNEMLGMGALDLKDLYDASLLEQCKRIEIQRRGKHLACLYFKITLQRDSKASKQIKRDLCLTTQMSADSDEKSSSANDKQQQQQQHQTTQAQQQTSQSSTVPTTENTSSAKDSAQNKNVKIESTNFADETSKIRLLKGFISANETRNLEMSVQQPTFLVCRRFWLEEPAAIEADERQKFNYNEQFSVINDEKFLQRVDKQYLHLELWQRMSCDDGNGNPEQNVKPIGVVRMPLHQFFIAYRDSAITNHLCKGQLPVISIDAWTPIISCHTGLNVGELKCLLAVGSEEQIQYLKDSRGFTSTTPNSLILTKNIKQKLQPLQIPAPAATSSNTTQSTSARIKKTSDLLDMLQKVLMTPPTTAADAQSPTKTAPSAMAAAVAESSTHTSGALKPLTPSNVKLFKFSLEIQKAMGLPLNPASKAKKGSAKRNASKRFPPNEPPSCYVTFQSDEGPYQTYKSHEGLVFATNIVEKSTQPQWEQRFRLAADIDYLNNPQKRFILKVWKKSSLDMAQGRTQPTPMEDAIIGFAALDLAVFVRGLHIGGTFNIVDFNGRINGQLAVRCQPLEEIPLAVCAAAAKATIAGATTSSPAAANSVDSVIDQFEQTLDLTHLNLGQAIKRKFTELEGISQRLRVRLGDVTGAELPTNFDLDSLNAWQPLANDANDNDIDEFEQDLNTPPPTRADMNDDDDEDEAHNTTKLQGKTETDQVEFRE